MKLNKDLACAFAVARQINVMDNENFVTSQLEKIFKNLPKDVLNQINNDKLNICRAATEKSEITVSRSSLPVVGIEENLRVTEIYRRSHCGAKTYSLNIRLYTAPGETKNALSRMDSLSINHLMKNQDTKTADAIDVKIYKRKNKIITNANVMHSEDGKPEQLSSDKVAYYIEELDEKMRSAIVKKNMTVDVF